MEEQQAQQIFTDEQSTPTETTDRPIFEEAQQEASTTYQGDQLRKSSMLTALADIQTDPNKVDEDIDSLYPTYINALQYGEEGRVRQNIGEQAKTSEAATLDRVIQDTMKDPTIEDRDQLMEGFVQRLKSFDTNASRPNLVEEAATDQMLDMAASEDAAMYTHRLNQIDKQGTEGNFLSDTARYITRYNRVQQELDKIVTEQQGQSGLRDVYDFFESTLNLPDYYLALNNLVDTGKSNINLGEKVLEQRAVLFDTSIDDLEFEGRLQNLLSEARNGGVFQKILPENRSKSIQLLQTIMEADENKRDSINMWGVVDAASLGLTVGVKPLQTLKTFGLRTRAGNIVASELKSTVDNIVSKSDAINETLTSNLSKTPTKTPDISLTDHVSRVEEETARVIEELQKYQAPSRLTDREYGQVIERATATVQDEFKGYNVVDVATTRKSGNILNDVQQLEVSIGKRTGGGYSSEGSATSAAKRMGLEDFTIGQDSSGLSYIKINRSVDESDVLEGFSTNPKKDILSAFVSRYVFGNKFNITDDAVANANIGKKAIEGIHAEVIMPIMARIDKVKGVDRKALASVWEEGHTAEKWFSEGELIAKGMKPVQVEAYAAMRTLNDVDHYIRNLTEYKKFATHGYKTVGIKNEATGWRYEGVGKVRDPNQVNLSKDRLYDVSSDTHYPEGTLTKENLDNLINNQGYQIVSIEDFSRDVANDNPVKHLLVKKGDATVKELSTQIVPYKAGGHRVYEGKWFIKQARTGTFSDTGKKYMLNPLTHVVSKTRKEAIEWAETMEKARLDYKVYKANRTTKTELQARESIENTAVGDLETWERYVEEGKLDADNVFQVVFDREELPEVVRSRSVGTQQFGDAELSSGLTQWMSTNKKSMSGVRGDHLINPQDELAPIINPFRAVNKGLVSAIRSGEMYNYTSAAVERWAEAAIKSGKLDAELLSKHPSPYELFNKSVFSQVDSETMQLGAQRDVIRRMMNTQTTGGKIYAETMKNIGLFMENVPQNEWAARKAYDMMSADPLTAIKGFAFHTKLGLLNISQFPLQINTAIAAVMIDPVNGVKGWSSWMPMRHAVMNQDPKLLEKYATQYKWAHGLEPEEFKTMITELRASGNLRIGNNIAELDSTTNNALYNNNMAEKALNFGRKVFFDEAEILNRSVAYRMAWSRMRAKFPDMEVTSDTFRKLMDNETSMLSMNMTTAHSSALNSGWTSIPTQFMSYGQRFMESFVGRGLTGAEKARLAVGTMTMYGYSAVPGVDDGVDWLLEKYGRDVPPEFRRVARNGLFDATIYGMTGGEADLDLSTRYAPVGGVEDFVKSIFDPNTSFMDVAGGPGFTIVSDAIGTVWESVQLIKASESLSDIGMVTEQALLDVADEITAFSNLHKAKVMYDMGRIQLSNGSVLDVASKQEAFARALGIPTRRENDTYLMKKDIVDTQQEINSEAKVHNKLRMELNMAHQKGDFAKVERLRRVIELNLRRMDRGTQEGQRSLRTLVIERANKLMDWNTFTNTRIKHERLLGETPINQVEEVK